MKNTTNNHPVHTGMEKKFLDSMKRGNVWSRSQVKAMWKLANPSAAMIRFAEAGEPVQRTYVWDKKAKSYKVRYFI